MVEATMDRFHALRRIAEAEHEARAGAKRKADELLNRHRGSGGGE